MALQSSGAISHEDIQNEFGGSSPIGLDEYYGVAAGIPQSGPISNADFYGASAAPAAPTISYLVTGSNYANSFATRYGWSLANKSRFVHPETGQNTNSFGSITGYVGIVGGYDLWGIHVTDYSGYSNNIDDKFIVLTVGNPYGTNPNWTVLKCKLSNQSDWSSIHRDNIAGFGSNSLGSGIIYWRRGAFSSSYGKGLSFDPVYNNIRNATSSNPMQFYFE